MVFGNSELIIGVVDDQCILLLTSFDVSTIGYAEIGKNRGMFEVAGEQRSICVEGYFVHWDKFARDIVVTLSKC